MKSLFWDVIVPFAPLVVLGTFLIIAFVAIIAELCKPSKKMVAQQGWTVQWRGQSGGRSPSYWVWVNIPGDPAHFVKVFSYGLYNAGIGYTLGRQYDGFLEDRP